MNVKSFKLLNIGRFSDLGIPLASLESHNTNVTVFVGNNGSGKTSILKSLSTGLSWLVSRIQSEKGNGLHIPELAIKNGKSSAAIEIIVESSNNENAFWRVTKVKKGRKNEYHSDYSGATHIAHDYRSSLSENESTSLPLIAFYSVERVVLDIPLKLRGKHSFLQLDGYDNSLSQGVDFRRFFEWFREREDSENEAGLSDDVLTQIQSLLGDDDSTWEKLQSLKASTKDIQLTAVRTAISRFMPGFSNLRVKRKPRLQMLIDKNSETLNVAQLSQGEKSLMALIGDIARRLAVMNPSLENPLEGDGIVLIDEIDMHLHPKWQRTLVRQLSATFPNCQFVLTTHSPLVISDTNEVLTYIIDDDDSIRQLPSMYGDDANAVLLGVMDTNVRNADFNSDLNDLLDDIHDGDILSARGKLTTLEKSVSTSNLELAKAKLLLRKQELRSAKNN